MNFAECTRESSSSDGWNADDSEDEENAKHIVGELKSNDRPTRKSRRIPPLCWVWKKRRRFRDGVKAAAIIISRFARFARRPSSSVRSKLCAVIQSQRFCVENFAHLHEPLVAWRKKMASRSSFFVHHKRRKKTERAAFIVPPKMHSFFWSLCLFCVLLSNTQRTTKPLFTHRATGRAPKKTHFLGCLYDRNFFFLFFQKSRTRAKNDTFSLSLVSHLSLSLERG